MTKTVVFTATTSGTVVKAGSGMVYHMQLTKSGSADTTVSVYDTPTIIGAAPTALTAALVATAGNLGIGAYIYKVTFTNAAGETVGGTSSNTITTSAGSQQANLTNIPTGPAGTTSRKIYRTIVGGADGTQLLLTTIVGNVTTIFTDNIADGSLTTAVPTVGVYTANLMWSGGGSANQDFDITDGAGGGMLCVTGILVVVVATTSPILVTTYN